MRVRQHVNPLDPHFDSFRGDVPAMPDGVAVECEIGCADAQFLFERAAAAPDRVYVGLEIRRDFIALVNRRARERAAPVHAVLCQAQLHMDRVFAAGRLDRAYVNFPDPWFKRRHHERRMVDDVLVSNIARALRAGGEAFVQTDIWDLAIEALGAFERDGQLVNAAGEWTFWRDGNPFGARSWREQHAEEHGLPIWRLLFRRR
jgi:tRNA (guanine-N7-)-methyltransferase